MISSSTGRALYVFALLGVGALAGCTSQAPESAPQSLTDLTPAQQRQKERAIAAKDELFQSLLGELTKALEEQGPAKSISVCRKRAPEIAEEVSRKTGIRIGRTSFRLRNRDNVAPEWAAPFVKQRVEEEIVLPLPEDTLAVLLPIRLKTTCTLCHGDEQQILPDVKAAIAMNYPRDQATGFAEGDLRGYFWVEVPATPGTDNQ